MVYRMGGSYAAGGASNSSRDKSAVPAQPQGIIITIRAIGIRARHPRIFLKRYVFVCTIETGRCQLMTEINRNPAFVPDALNPHSTVMP